jgi:uncharacterized integral membrane protein
LFAWASHFSPIFQPLFQESSLRILYTALLILFIGGIVVFCFQNLDTVTVSYLGWTLSVPMPILILVVYLFGMVSGWGVFSFLKRSLKVATHKSE